MYKKYTNKKRKKFIYRGISFASKAERNFAEWMDNNNIPWMYESEKFYYVLPTRRYTPDFKVSRNNGSYFFVEFKGYLRPEDRTKIKAFIEQNPEIDFRIIFLNKNNKINPRSNTTYAEWAEKLSIPYAQKEIPKEWMEEIV